MLVPSYSAKQRIVILGGGFAGVNALITLEKLFSGNSNVELTIISEENFLLFTPMLSEVAIGTVDPRHIATPIREICKNAKFHKGEVSAIDLTQQSVEVTFTGEPAETRTFYYDHLVLALGSKSNLKIVPGVEQYAFDFKNISDAVMIRTRILDLFEQADTCQDPNLKQALLTFAIIGGGYSGVEVATAIQEMALRIQPLYPNITPQDIHVLVVEGEDSIIRTMPPDLSAYALQALTDKGIKVVLKTWVHEVRPTSLSFSTGEQIESHTIIWTTGIKLPDLLMNLAGTQKDLKGRPLATPELRLAGFQNVWAIGDNVVIPTTHPSGYYAPTAQNAVQAGKHVAHNIYKIFQGQAPEPFNYKSKGEMVVLGERSAVAMVAGFKVKGLFAWVLWRLFYLSALPSWKKRVRVALDWLLNMVGPLETAQIRPTHRKNIPSNSELAKI